MFCGLLHLLTETQGDWLALILSITYLSEERWRINRTDMPVVHIIGGPNGAGKTTLARTLLQQYDEGAEFVNADHIAQGLSAFKPESVSFDAGRTMLDRIHSLSRARKDFAFESTLASRFFAGFLRELKKDGYDVALTYVWLRSPELAIRRVMLRARQGGHDVPRDVIVRRYARGMTNLRNYYLDLADRWQVYDNSDATPLLISEKRSDPEAIVYQKPLEPR